MIPPRKHILRKRVTYSECTLGNHVYYARYLDFLEEARGEFFRSIGFPLLQLQEVDIVFPVIECSLKYLRAARYDNQLEIATWVGALSQVRLRFENEIFRDGQLLLRAATEHVCASTGEKPRRMPEELRAALNGYYAPTEAA